VEAWLEKTNYPLWRKVELLEKWGKMTHIRDKKNKYFECKSFMKDETYPEFKYPRAINSRSDEFKCYVGPIFKLIEEAVFRLDWFIKKIPVAERPEFIRRKLLRNGGIYKATDYTAFEANFRKKLMEVCEFELYDFMTSHLPTGKDFMSIIREALLGTNKCVFKYFDVFVKATRMSGEMCTSLGNGFSNLMFMLFMCDYIGTKDVDGVVEGDDGLFTGHGPWPTEEDFAQLGLMLKMETHSELSEASFCGLIFDTEELINVTDPLEVLSSFGWTSGVYCRSRRSKLNALLRAKALSVAYQYSGCPILTALARYGLRVTRGYDVRPLLEQDRTMSLWYREQLLEALRHPVLLREPGPRTRLLVEKKYGISVETQLAVEKYLDQKNDLEPISSPYLINLIPVQWKHYSDKYVMTAKGKDKNWSRPAAFHTCRQDIRRSVFSDLEWDGHFLVKV